MTTPTKKNTKFTTPRAVASYPYFNKPDTKFDEEGVYKADLKIALEDGQELIELCDKELEAFIAELTNKTGKKQNRSKFRVPYEIDEDEGTVTFKVKQNAQIKGKPVTIVIYDSKGKRIANPPLIRGGSTVKVSGTIRSYESGANKGVTLSISAVQLIKLSEGADLENGDRFGFGEEDDGYSQDADQFDHEPDGYEADEDDNNDDIPEDDDL